MVLGWAWQATLAGSTRLPAIWAMAALIWRGSCPPGVVTGPGTDMRRLTSSDGRSRSSSSPSPGDGMGVGCLGVVAP